MKNKKSSTSSLFLLSKFYCHVSRNRRYQFIMLLILTIVSAFAEVVSLGAIVPFIGILTEPEKVFSYPAMAGVISILEIKTAADLALPLTMIFAFAALFAGVLRLTLLWFSIRYANAIGADFGTDAYNRTLHQSYSVHVARSSSKIISGITQKVGVATGVLLSLVIMLTSSVLFVAILFTLIFIDPVVASIAMMSFGTGYGIIAWMTRHRLFKNSESVAKEQTEVMKSLQEGLGGIRDILLDGSHTVDENAKQVLDVLD